MIVFTRIRISRPQLQYSLGQKVHWAKNPPGQEKLLVCTAQATARFAASQGLDKYDRQAIAD